MTFRDAFRLVHAARPYINPNRGFMQQLLQLELQTHGTVTLQLDAAGTRHWL
jgi:hypothetical protein